jgi:hypothetical protein
MSSETPVRREAPSTFAQSADAWFTPVRFAVLLALLIFIFFPEVMLGTRTFVYSDFGLYAYPVGFLHRQSFWRGEIPLWNPLNNCGIPLLAEWNTLVLYPFSVVYLLFPLSWSLGVFCLAHLFLEGMGMYFLAYRWTGNRLAASVAGLAFAFNGCSLSALIWPHLMASLAWMPFVMLTAERAWEKGGRSVISASIVGTLQMLAGPPEVVLITWLIVGTLWMGQCAGGKLPVSGSFKRLLVLVLAISALSASQLFPFFELLMCSQRDSGYATGQWSMPPTGWANFLVPLFYCYKIPAGHYLQYTQGMIPSYYLGIGVLALALFAVCRLRDWKVWLLGGIAGLSLILALGDAGYLYKFLRQILPQLGFMRFPVKFVMLAAFAIPLLAAFGLQNVLSAARAKRMRTWRFLAVLCLAMLALISFILWFARSYPAGQEPWLIPARNGAGRVAFLLAMMGTLFLIGRARDGRRRGALGFALLALFWLDIVTHAPAQNPTVARTVYEPGLQPFQELRPKPIVGESRAMISSAAIRRFRTTALSDPFSDYLGVRLGLLDNCNLLDGLPKVDGFYSLYVREEFETEKMLYLSSGDFSRNLADFLGVCQITAPGKLFEWEARPGYMPWFTAGQKPVFVDETNSLRALFDPAFDPRQVVYLPFDAAPFITVTNRTRARIVSRQFFPHKVVLEVEAERPSMVVAAQTYYPSWRAYVDGQPTRLWRANHAFQAFQVPAGLHEVQLVYRDRNFIVGTAISVVTLVGCIVGLLRAQSGRAFAALRLWESPSPTDSQQAGSRPSLCESIRK